MTRIAHLSDLHFGRTDPVVVEALRADIHHLRPDLVIVSGDLTQRARSHQFAQAREFLDHLGAPSLVVPGNHDLAPVYRPLDRIFNPRAKFQRHLPGHEAWPVHRSEGLLAIGLDSTRSLRWDSGHLKPAHLDHVAALLADAPPHWCKLVFLHHPMHEHGPAAHPFADLAELGVDVVLAGHVHKAHMAVLSAPRRRSLVLVQASTACSTRLREDANGYCLLTLGEERIGVEVRGWSGHVFHPVRHGAFARRTDGWHAVTAG